MPTNGPSEFGRSKDVPVSANTSLLAVLRVLVDRRRSLGDEHTRKTSGAARLLVEVGDITRFPDNNHFGSWNGTARSTPHKVGVLGLPEDFEVDLTGGDAELDRSFEVGFPAWVALHFVDDHNPACHEFSFSRQTSDVDAVHGYQICAHRQGATSRVHRVN
jgi:hypothetical protein